MKKSTLVLFAAILSFCSIQIARSQPVPEILWYKFDVAGTSVTNYASAPPAGTATGTLNGGLTQGGTGQCGHTLIGTGAASSTDYVNTGWATSFPTRGWTISFWTSNIGPSATLFYIFGDANSGSFRCFTNGVAGANNWILRGPFTDVPVTGAAIVAPTLTTFVYDSLAGNIKAYVNGVLVNTVTEAPITISGAGPYKVCGYATNVGLPAAGNMDEYRIYNRPLSAAEVMQLMYPHTSSTINVTKCNSYTSPSGLHTWTSPGTYNDTILNVANCDSIITINLNIITEIFRNLTVTEYFSYTSPSGLYTWTNSGIYNDTIPSVGGCDSIITIDLTIRTNPEPGLLYYKFDESGTTVTNYGVYQPAGTATATLTGTITQGNNGQCGGALIGTGGSGNVDYLNTGWATSLNNTSWTISFWSSDIGAVSPATYIFGDATAGSFRCFTGGAAGTNNWLLRGSFNEVYANGAATTSPTLTTFVYDKNLGNIKSYVNGVLNSTVAQPPLYISGMGFHVGSYNSGPGLPLNGLMDEFRFYDRALSQPEILALLDLSTTGSMSTTVCDSYVSPSGNYTWTGSGIYNDTIPNMAGCDSIITIDLTVKHATSSTINPEQCYSYLSPSGNYTWTTSGLYNDTIPNVAGCDSIIAVNLTIDNSTTGAISPEVCFSYVSPSGLHTWTSSGMHADTIPNVAGCDSIISINLTIKTVDTAVTQSGITLTASASGATYQWLDCDDAFAEITGENAQSFTPDSDGNYAVAVTQNGCTDTSDCRNVSGTGISTTEKAGRISVQPNPSTGLITITAESTPALIEISDIRGSRIMKIVPSNQATVIDLSELEPGMYMVKVLLEKNVYVNRIILTR
ncbi:MAG: LamG-like jellyroll fold domain-containing protein [Bacteroidota bacterium]